MFAQPRLIHNSRVSFYTSRNAYCQEFIDLVLKCPGNLWFIFHLHLRVPEKRTRTRLMAYEGRRGWQPDLRFFRLCHVLTPSRCRLSVPYNSFLSKSRSLFSVHFCSTLEVKNTFAAFHWLTHGRMFHQSAFPVQSCEYPEWMMWMAQCC